MGIYNHAVCDEAIAQVDALITTDNADELATRLEQIAAWQDLAHVCLMLLVMKARGIDTSTKTGMELANPVASIADLILPPGVRV